VKVNATGATPSTGLSPKDALAAKENNDFQSVLQRVQEEKDDQKLREACQEMEAIFVLQLLRQMRATVPKSGLLEESTASRIYKDMLDEEYSKLIAKSPNSLGIEEMLYRQLKQKQGADEDKK